MAEQTVTFDFSLNEKVKITATDADAWVVGLFISADGVKQYNINTTLPSGQPDQKWLRAVDLAAIPPE